MRVIVTTVVLWTALAIGRAGGGDPEDERKKLLGTWEVTFIEAGGVKASAVKVNKGLQFIFMDSSLKIVSPQDKEAWELSYQIDGKKKPREIDLVNLDGPVKGKKALGIYALDGASLKVCFPDDPEDEKFRPKGFSTRKGSTLKVYTMKRAKL